MAVGSSRKTVTVHLVILIPVAFWSVSVLDDAAVGSLDPHRGLAGHSEQARQGGRGAAVASIGGAPADGVRGAPHRGVGGATDRGVGLLDKPAC